MQRKKQQEENVQKKLEKKGKKKVSISEDKEPQDEYNDVNIDESKDQRASQATSKGILGKRKAQK